MPDLRKGSAGGKAPPHGATHARTVAALWTRRIGYRLFRLTGELTAIVLGAAFIWFYTLNALLAQKTLDVSFVKPNASLWFAQAFKGRAATMGDLTLSWHPEMSGIVLDARNIIVTDARKAPLQNFSQLQATFDFDDVITGYARPKAVKVTGGALTWLRGDDGAVVAGLGTPETVGRFGTFISEADASQSSRQPFTMSGLRALSIQNTDVFVRDAQTGLDFKLADTDLTLTDEGEKFHVIAEGKATSGDDESPVDIDLRFSSDFEDFDLAFHASDFNGAKFAPKADMLAALKRVNAPADIRLDMSATRAGGLKKVTLNVNMGAGEIDTGSRQNALKAFVLSADYDPEVQSLRADVIKLQSSLLSLEGQAEFGQIGRPATGFMVGPVTFKTALTDVHIDAGARLDAPLHMRALNASGQLDRVSRTLDLEAITIDFSDFRLNASTSIMGKPGGGLSAVSGRGRVAGAMDAKQLLSLWPAQFAAGARRWIDRAVLAGQIENIKFDLKVSESAFSGAPLRDDDLSLTFNVANADVRYISTMSPYTGVSGSGVLRGNSFEITTQSGDVGGLEVERAHVDIPRLNPRGGDFTIDVAGRGNVQNMLSLIDQEPFEFPKRYGIDPKDFSGNGAINLTITRPLLEFFDAKRIRYAVDGNFTEVAVPFEFGGHKLEKGDLALRAGKDGMHLKGPVNLGPWRADMVWEENFAAVAPTVYRLAGPMNRETFDGFGLGLREYFGGEIEVIVDALGTGLSISESSLKADLTSADIRIGEYWSKDAGIAADMTASLSRSEDGAIDVNAMKVTAPGLSIAGRLALGPNMQLSDFILDEAKIDGFVDGRVAVKPNADKTAFDVKASGGFLDISPFVSQAVTSQASSLSLPMNLSVDVDRLALNEMLILNDAALRIDHNGIGTRAAQITGLMPDGLFRAVLTPKPEQDGRSLVIDIPNASVAVAAFLKSNNIRGGRLNIAADLPNVGDEGPLVGEIKIEDVVLVRAPILAQMLSLASLKGLTDTMGGAGLEFREVSIPFSYEGGDFSVRDGRASGPALGLTGSGDISFPDKVVDFDGVLVPAYTANSVLESIPVIGDIFVGKKGEGIFALSYVVRGPFSATQVGVNPLSALTPGFLRRIFDTQRDDLSGASETETPQTQPLLEPPNPDGPR